MVWGGLFHNIDTSTTVVGGVVHLGKGIDNYQTLLSLVSPVASSGNIVTDDLNLASPITTTSFPKGLGQYFPNGLTIPNVLRSGLALTTNADTAFHLTAASSTATYPFQGIYVTHPFCWASDETTAGGIKVTYNTTVSVTFTTPGATDVIDGACIGHN